MKPAILPHSASQEALAALPGWQIVGNELVREFQFPAYLDGIDFVGRIARLAEAMNHHPDLHVGWRKVTVRLSTHSAGGLTGLDFDMAEQIGKEAP